LADSADKKTAVSAGAAVLTDADNAEEGPECR
jgi:hypothetical protein